MPEESLPPQLTLDEARKEYEITLAEFFDLEGG